MNPQPWQAIVALSGFSVGIRCHRTAVTAIAFLPQQPELPTVDSLASEVARQLLAWQSDIHFYFDLPLEACGTPFQQRVWQAIKAIAPGKTRSYGEIAAELGSAPRAVGQACGANPFPIIIPCHRVISATGGLGGFARSRDGFLPDIKRRLLEREGISLASHPRLR